MSGEDGNNTKREAMDQGLRDEAMKEMELAIKSFKLKMQNKEVDVATMASPEDNDLARKEIGEMKEVITDMEQRVSIPKELSVLHQSQVLTLGISSST